MTRAITTPPIVPTTSTERLRARIICAVAGAGALALVAGAVFHVVLGRVLDAAQLSLEVAERLPFGEKRYTLLEDAARQADLAAALSPSGSQAYTILARVRLLQSVGLGLTEPSAPLLQAAQAAAERAAAHAPLDPAPMAVLAEVRHALAGAGAAADAPAALAASYARASIAPDLVDRRVALAGELWGQLDPQARERVLQDLCAASRARGGPSAIADMLTGADPALAREADAVAQSDACR